MRITHNNLIINIGNEMHLDYGLKLTGPTKLAQNVDMT